MPVINKDERLKTLSQRYLELRDLKRDLKKQEQDANDEMAMISQELVPILTEMEAQNVKLSGIGTVYLQTAFYVKAIPEKVEELVAWLDEKNLGHLAKRNIHYQTLQSEYQKWSDEDKPLPPSELVSAFAKTEVRIRKS